MAAVVLAVAASVAGCAQGRVSAAGLQGATLDEVSSVIPSRDDLIVVVQDASPLVDRDPTFSVDQSSSSQWTVIAACSDTEDLASAMHLELVVVPTESVTPQIRKGIGEERYADTAVCDWNL